MYTTFDGNKLPDYRDIVLWNVHSVTPGWLTLLGLDAQHRIEVSLENITVDGVKREQITAANSVVRMAGGNLPWEDNGGSVTKLRGRAGTGGGGAGGEGGRGGGGAARGGLRAACLAPSRRPPPAGRGGAPTPGR